MSVSSLTALSHQRMLNILGYGSTSQISTAAGSTSAAKSGQPSPFAEMLTELQQMEQSNPTQYSQVSQQISTNLSTAAATAQTQGNSTLAARLNTLSKDFASASQTGQLPNMGDLLGAMSSGSSSQSLATTLGGTAAAAAAGTSAGSANNTGVLSFMQNLTGF